MSSVEICAFFDPQTATVSYVVWDVIHGDAVVIDPVMDYDAVSKTVSSQSMQKMVEFVRRKNLLVHWILETHVHADHLSSAREMKRQLGGARWGMAASLDRVFDSFRALYKWPAQVKLSNLGLDRWFCPGEEFSAGQLRVQVIATPGHTPACLTYQIGDNLFTGDALMMPDNGVGRCDFPHGSASLLYSSVWGTLYSFPDSTRIYVGHDYQPGGRPLRYQTTVGEQKARNIHIRASTSRADFIQFREARDKTLSAPRLLAESMDWNLGAHQMAPATFPGCTAIFGFSETNTTVKST